MILYDMRAKSLICLCEIDAPKKAWALVLASF